jgi:hypothetical protein
MSLDNRIQVETQATKTLVETMPHGLKAKRAEVTDDFHQALETTRRGFKMQLAKVEARAERGACQKSETGASTAKPPKFDGYTSCAVFRRQLGTAAEHNCWTLQREPHI